MSSCPLFWAIYRSGVILTEQYSYVKCNKAVSVRNVLLCLKISAKLLPLIFHGRHQSHITVEVMTPYCSIATLSLPTMPPHLCDKRERRGSIRWAISTYIPLATARQREVQACAPSWVAKAPISLR